MFYCLELSLKLTYKVYWTDSFGELDTWIFEKSQWEGCNSLLVFLIGGPAFIFLAWELWKPSWGSAPSQRFRASLVTEGLKFGILLEKCCWDGWDAQVMVPATSSTSCDKKWRASCLLPGYCEFCWHKGCPLLGVGQTLGTSHLSCINLREQLSTS